MVVVMAAVAAAATDAGAAMGITVQTGTASNQLSAAVADAVDFHTSASAQLKGGLMIVN